MQSTPGCEISFTSSISDSILIVICGACGGPSNGLENVFPTFQCTGGASEILPQCPNCPAMEDFENGMLDEWTFEVTGTADN